MILHLSSGKIIDLTKQEWIELLTEVQRARGEKCQEYNGPRKMIFKNVKQE